MCLIVVAHRAAERFPLIIAANRDEDHERPSLPAEFWESEEIIGGRDALHGGSWLALSRNRRFAAVTNLRGASRVSGARSRGELVTDFVRGSMSPEEYGADVERRVTEYGGFHLLAGVIGGPLVHVSEAMSSLAPGVYGLSNAPAGVVWPKVDRAVGTVRGALESTELGSVTEPLLRMLRSTGSGDPTRDAFVHGERYGTRASTVVVAGEDEVLFIERSFGPAGAAGAHREYRYQLP